MTRWQVGIVALVLVSLLIDGVDIQLLALVSPVVIAEWGVDRASFGPAMAGALVGMSVGAFIGGWLGDRSGRKKVLIGAMLMFGVTTMAAAATDGITAMTAMRLISGVGFGAAAPNAIALASEYLPGSARPLVAALLSVGTPLGGIAGASIVLQLLPQIGWRGCFVASGAVTLLLALLLTALLPDSPMSLLKSGRQREMETIWKKITAGTLAVPVQISEPGRRSASIFVPMYRRLNIGASITFFCTSFVAYALITWSPVMLTASRWPLPQALQGTMAFNASAVVAALVAASAIRHIGSRRLLLVCSVGSVVAVLGLGVALAPSGWGSDDARWLGIAALAVAGGCTGAGLASVYAVLTHAYSAECRGSGIGFGMMMGRLGAIATVLSGGYLLNIGQSTPVYLLSALGVSAALMAAGTLIVDRHVQGAAGRSD